MSQLLQGANLSFWAIGVVRPWVRGTWLDGPWLYACVPFMMLGFSMVRWHAARLVLGGEQHHINENFTRECMALLPTDTEPPDAYGTWLLNGSGGLDGDMVAFVAGDDWSWLTYIGKSWVIFSPLTIAAWMVARTLR